MKEREGGGLYEKRKVRLSMGPHPREQSRNGVREGDAAAAAATAAVAAATAAVAVATAAAAKYTTRPSRILGGSVCRVAWPIVCKGSRSSSKEPAEEEEEGSEAN